MEVLRLQCEHLRTLQAQTLGELTTIDKELAAKGRAPAEIVAAPRDGVEQRSARLLLEATRVQSFLRSLAPKGPDGLGPASGSDLSPLPAETPGQ